MALGASSPIPGQHTNKPVAIRIRAGSKNACCEVALPGITGRDQTVDPTAASIADSSAQHELELRKRSDLMDAHPKVIQHVMLLP